MHVIVAAALRQRVLVIILGLALMAGGLFAYKQLNIEAYPDPVPPLVDIITQNPGQSAEEIERYITIPIEIQMAGIPHVTTVRTISLFGLSDVKVQFTYDFTYEEAEQRGICHEYCERTVANWLTGLLRIAPGRSAKPRRSGERAIRSSASVS